MHYDRNKGETIRKVKSINSSDNNDENDDKTTPIICKKHESCMQISSLKYLSTLFKI